MTRARDLVELDLAFHVNGTLEAEARAEVEALLAEDARLRSEAEALAVIRAEMQAEGIRSPGEFGLARLLRDVAREHGVAVIVRVAFDEGALTGKFTAATTFAADDFRAGYFAVDRLSRAVPDAVLHLLALHAAAPHR